MLAFLGFAMVATFLALMMTKRLLPLVALTLVPLGYGILAALLGHFPTAKLGPMLLDGLKTLAPTGVMLLFAILYFALMIDRGLFDGVVAWILRRVKGDPLKVALGTVALTLIVSLDGDGSTTYMICVAALLPLYQRHGGGDVQKSADHYSRCSWATSRRDYRTGQPALHVLSLQRRFLFWHAPRARGGSRALRHRPY